MVESFGDQLIWDSTIPIFGRSHRHGMQTLIFKFSEPELVLRKPTYDVG